MKHAAICLGILWCLSVAAPVRAQGLLWSLPEDGSWIRFEGTYTQTIRRPDSAQGPVELRWTRFLTIKSVGREDAEYRGVSQPCRWIEIKAETGRTAEGVLDAGPGGVRMYKLLVPESEIKGLTTVSLGEDRSIFAETIPVVKGLRRIGDEPAAEITGGVFQLYPAVSLLRHYRELEPAGGATTLNLPVGDVPVEVVRGQMVMETTLYRSTNTCEIARTSALPFGVAKWMAKVVTEVKNSTESRAQFRESVTLVEEMQAVSKGTGAESDFLN